MLAVPNPQSGAVLRLAVDLEFDADSLLVQTYTKAMTCLASQELRGPFRAGWNSVSLPLAAPSNGLYYLLVTGKLDSGESAVGPAGKLLVIR